MRKFLGLFVLTAISVAVGLVAGYFLHSPSIENPVYGNTDEEVRVKGYKYISPLLECEERNGINSKELNDLEEELNTYIDSKISQGVLKDASVYYRDLNNGPWIGVNERADYAPASLLKVPVMIAYYKEADHNLEFLNQTLEYKKHENAIPQNFPPKKRMVYGKRYTVDQLIEQMIAQSDNDALLTLVDNIPMEKIDKVQTDLGVTTSSPEVDKDYISVKSYASFFRILYNASYLSPSMSEKALELLSKEEFYEGIKAGLPRDIVVANKFGERKTSDFEQLHDCGIVYYPKSPYLLCVMTRGETFDNLSETIAEISRKVYLSIGNPYK